ncbi:flagellar hook-length control protein FliK [Colwellia sp. MSW7]|uniref:Flagellar hook-length control protein FliK n=1 Tax=Colwellia maritima TaxID=2912588 RepID=A0ABS9X2Z8_9GAMM|nr:flagellar hook-length control protein FliK [Colwellia maritima]MCI2284608.1 flagellar hook-length control protein FliK [Colwellia maritima]
MRIPTFEESAEIQKVKGEAQLFLKSSDLIADLSGVAKAIKSTSETGSAYSFEQEKLQNIPKVSASEGKETQDVKPLLTKPSIDGNALANVTTNNTDNTDNIDETPVDISNNAEEKSVDLVQNKAINAGVTNTIDSKTTSQPDAGLAVNKVDDNAVKASSQIVGDVEKAAKTQIQQAREQDDLMSERINIDVNQKASILKSEDEIQATAVTKSMTSQNMTSQSMAKKNANDEVLLENELISDEERLTTEQNENVKAEKGILKSADKLISVNSNAQQSFTQPVVKDKVQHSGTDSLGEATAESLDKEVNLKSSESQLSTKIAENPVEQSKEVVGDSKELNPKGMAKTNTDFAFNTNSSDATNRATLATHDRVEHQTIDTINPMSSTEVAQSQKTNTQLHNETISIFRKDFSEAVKDKVMLMISQKLQQFDITLDPPELGNIHVKVNLQGEQATVNFIVQNQQAKEALDQNMQKLRDMLANQGVDVGDANVEQQSQQSNSNEKGDDTNHRSVTNTAEASDVLEHTVSARMIESSTRGIDYYA